jgi:hypothetical protein
MAGSGRSSKSLVDIPQCAQEVAQAGTELPLRAQPVVGGIPTAAFFAAKR